MSNSVMSVVKGVTFGVVAGMAAGYVGTKMLSANKKSMKKKANRALREMGNMIDTASYMFK
ncbi:MAG: hypothetical protein IJC86_01985 [Clostridia bacterium]|nr:hypothetical protein [Clostridia bacterium]